MRFSSNCLRERESPYWLAYVMRSTCFTCSHSVSNLSVMSIAPIVRYTHCRMRMMTKQNKSAVPTHSPDGVPSDHSTPYRAINSYRPTSRNCCVYASRRRACLRNQYVSSQDFGTGSLIAPRRTRHGFDRTQAGQTSEPIVIPRRLLPFLGTSKGRMYSAHAPWLPKKLLT